MELSKWACLWFCHCWGGEILKQFLFINICHNFVCTYNSFLSWWIFSGPMYSWEYDVCFQKKSDTSQRCDIMYLNCSLLIQEHTTMCYSSYLLVTDPPAGWHSASWQDILWFLTSWELSSWYVILSFSPQPAGSIPAGKSHPIIKIHCSNWKIFT